MPLETSAESPVPVRTVLRLVGDWIGKLGRVWVEGQIAELTRRGGTVFLTLRDPVAAVSVRVICPRTVLEAAEPAPAEGARVVVWAKPDFNTARGSFGLAATEIRAVGIGELLARLERLRRSLAAEGLFATERKRRLPFLPGSIGLICGRDSAAQRDVQRNAARRWPAVRFRVEPVAVQGSYAVAEVTDALHRLDFDPAVDVIIIARGGGSLEDLLPFSDESLIRAVAACRTPVVSAIGHEQDTPLLDLVADVRASTPTDAARRVVPDVAEQLALIAQLRGRSRRILEGRLDRETSWLAGLRSRPVLADPLREMDRRQELINALTERGRRCVTAELTRAREDMSHVRARLLALSPAATMRRGYSIVQRGDGAVVRAAAEVTTGERLTVRFAADRLTVMAERADAGEASGEGTGARRTDGGRADGEGTGGGRAGGKRAGGGRKASARIDGEQAGGEQAARRQASGGRAGSGRASSGRAGSGRADGDPAGHKPAGGAETGGPATGRAGTGRAATGRAATGRGRTGQRTAASHARQSDPAG